MKLTAKAAGTFAIAPTPFHDDGRIDERSIDRLTDFYADVGCDGVISSGLEAQKLRSTLDPRLVVVTPGIRQEENRPADDQKRVVSVEQAFAWGADYIVGGRPIRNATDPRAAAEGIQGTIAKLFPA